MILTGDALAVLRTLPDGCVNCCVTSPPYWGLRNYESKHQIGQEPDFVTYVERLVSVFSEVRRVLKADGTVWLNLGDSYTSGGRKSRDYDKKLPARSADYRPPNPNGLKDKELIGIPWRVAFALQADGWYLRQDIIWHKPNPMPESVRDRCTKSHEYVFLLTKSSKYYFNHEAMREPVADPRASGNRTHKYVTKYEDSASQEHRTKGGLMTAAGKAYQTRNRRSVWTITPVPYREAHFATFPPELPTICIAAGCPPGGVVLDPFSGAGTTGLACTKLGMEYVGIELNPEYVSLSEWRLSNPTA